MEPTLLPPVGHDHPFHASMVRVILPVTTVRQQIGVPPATHQPFVSQGAKVVVQTVLEFSAAGRFQLTRLLMLPVMKMEMKSVSEDPLVVSNRTEMHLAG